MVPESAPSNVITAVSLESDITEVGDLRQYVTDMLHNFCMFKFKILIDKVKASKDSEEEKLRDIKALETASKIVSSNSDGSEFYIRICSEEKAKEPNAPPADMDDFDPIIPRRPFSIFIEEVSSKKEGAPPFDSRECFFSNEVRKEAKDFFISVYEKYSGYFHERNNLEPLKGRHFKRDPGTGHGGFRGRPKIVKNPDGSVRIESLESISFDSVEDFLDDMKKISGEYSRFMNFSKGPTLAEFIEGSLGAFNTAPNGGVPSRA